MPIPNLDLGSIAATLGNGPQLAQMIGQANNQQGQQFDLSQLISQADLQQKQLQNQVTQGSLPDLMQHAGALNAQLRGQARETDARAQQTEETNKAHDLSGGAQQDAWDIINARNLKRQQTFAGNLRTDAITGWDDPDKYLESKRQANGQISQEVQTLVDHYKQNPEGRTFSAYLEGAAQHYARTDPALMGKVIIGEYGLKRTELTQEHADSRVGAALRQKQDFFTFKSSLAGKLQSASSPAALADVYMQMADQETDPERQQKMIARADEFKKMAPNADITEAKLHAMPDLDALGVTSPKAPAQPSPTIPQRQVQPAQNPDAIATGIMQRMKNGEDTAKLKQEADAAGIKIRGLNVDASPPTSITDAVAAELAKRKQQGK